MSSSTDYAGFWQRALALLIDWLIVGGIIVGFWRHCGATPGKLAVGLKVVDAQTGGRPSTGRLVVRVLCYVVSAIPLYLGFLWVAVDRRKQGWHDKIAGTAVVQDNFEGDIP